MDLVATTNLADNERIFISDASTNGNHWLYLELNGPDYNTTGIGAAVYATINKGTPEERTLRREANTSAGTFNQSDLPVHFGLGASDMIDEMRIVWSDGTELNLSMIPADQYIYATYRDGIDGDLNGDGFVGIDDLNIVLVHWNQIVPHGSLQHGDVNGDGFVGVDDLNIPLLHWNTGTPPTANANIPEPATAALLIAVGGVMLRRSR